MSEAKYSVYFGRLGRIPEMRRTQDGGYVCDFSLAINQGKERPPIWKRVVVWGEVAQQCRQRLSKGSQVFIRGRESLKKVSGEGRGNQGICRGCGPCCGVCSCLEKKGENSSSDNLQPLCDSSEQPWRGNRQNAHQGRWVLKVFMTKEYGE